MSALSSLRGGTAELVAVSQGRLANAAALGSFAGNLRFNTEALAA